MSQINTATLSPDCSPRIQRDVLFARTRAGVVFHNTRTGFEIVSGNAYEFASKIVPFFDGNTSIGNLEAAIPVALQDLLHGMVGSLLERGFARDVRSQNEPPEDFDALFDEVFEQQLGYIDYYVDNSRSRFMDYRRRRFLVFGTTDMARSTVLGLVRNGAGSIVYSSAVDVNKGGAAGIALELERLAERGAPCRVDRYATSIPGEVLAMIEPGDMILVCAENLSAGEVARVSEFELPSAAHMVIAAQVAGNVLVGPLIGTSSDAHWIDAAARVAENEGPVESRDFWKEIAQPSRTAENRAPGRSLSGMIGNLLAFEAFRDSTGALPAETDGQVLIQDLDSMNVRSEFYLPAPDRAVPIPPPFVRLQLPAPIVGLDDDVFRANYDSVGPDQKLVQATMGVWTSFDDSDYEQLPVKVGSLAPQAGSASDSVIAFDLINVLGARRRAIRSAAIDYALSHSAAGERRLAVDGAAESIPLEAVAARVALARPTTQTGLVPLQGVALRDGAPAFVAAGAVYPQSGLNSSGLFTRTRFGSGADTSSEIAAGAAAISALAGYQLAATLSDASSLTPLTELTSAGKGVTYLIEVASDLGLALEVLEVAGPVPTIVVKYDGALGSGYALGYASSSTEAIEQALLGAVGAAQTGRSLPAEWPELAIESVKTGDSSSFVRREVTVESLFEWLESNRKDVVLVNISTPDLELGGLHVMRAILVDHARAS